MRYYLVTYCMGKHEYTEVSEDEFNTAKEIELKTYSQQGYSACFSERPSESTDPDTVTDIYFQYLDANEEGEFFFGFITR